MRTLRRQWLFSIVSCFLVSASLGQYRDLSTLPKYDCALQKVMTIMGSSTIIAAPDRSAGLEAILGDYCGTFGEKCIRKKESELAATDYAGNILAVGLMRDFRKWDALQTPIRRIAKGFAVNGKTFSDSLDGFVFVDSNRIVVAGNSLQAVKDAQLALTGGHDILVVQHGKITFFGNRAHANRFNWFNLQDLKNSNYRRTASPLFDAVYISQTWKDSIDHAKLNTALAAYAKQFLEIYQLAMPSKKITWFLHSNMQEYGTMSGMFGLTCPGNHSAGFSIRGEIHTNGFDTGLVKHEYSHYLFDASIPQDNNPAFFVEGCVEYVTNLNDTTLLRKRLATARKFRDTLNYTDLIVLNRGFYGQQSAANYAICGIFVKYLVDTFGPEQFKQFCLAPDKKTKAKDIFGVDFDTLVTNYKKWLNS